MGWPSAVEREAFAVLKTELRHVWATLCLSVDLFALEKLGYGTELGLRSNPCPVRDRHGARYERRVFSYSYKVSKVLRVAGGSQEVFGMEISIVAIKAANGRNESQLRWGTGNKVYG